MFVSEWKVPWKSTILNCYTSIESHWNKNDDSLGSPETEISQSPSSYKKCRPSALIGFQSNRNDNVCLADCWIHGGCGRKIRRCEGVDHSSLQVRHRPLCQGTKVRPSGRFQSPLQRPMGSLVAGMSAHLRDRHIRSLTWWWRIDRQLLFLLFLHERLCVPLMQTSAPHGQVWGSQILRLRYRATATRIASSDRRRPQDVIERANSQSLLCEAFKAINAAWSSSPKEPFQIVFHSHYYYYYFFFKFILFFKLLLLFVLVLLLKQQQKYIANRAEIERKRKK